MKTISDNYVVNHRPDGNQGLEYVLFPFAQLSLALLSVYFHPFMCGLVLWSDISPNHCWGLWRWLSLFDGCSLYWERARGAGTSVLSFPHTASVRTVSALSFCQFPALSFFHSIASPRFIFKDALNITQILPNYNCTRILLYNIDFLVAWIFQIDLWATKSINMIIFPTLPPSLWFLFKGTFFPPSCLYPFYSLSPAPFFKPKILMNSTPSTAEPTAQFSTGGWQIHKIPYRPEAVQSRSWWEEKKMTLSTDLNALWTWGIVAWVGERVNFDKCSRRVC